MITKKYISRSELDSDEDTNHELFCMLSIWEATFVNGKLTEAARFALDFNRKPPELEKASRDNDTFERMLKYSPPACIFDTLDEAIDHSINKWRTGIALEVKRLQEDLDNACTKALGIL